LREKLLAVLKVGISLGLLAYLFTRPQLQLYQTWATVSRARWELFALALIFYLGAVLCNVWKWQVLLQAQGVMVPLRQLLAHYLVGLFFANLPFSLLAGDLARGYNLARGLEGQGARVAVSVLVDRLMGLASFLVAAAVMLVYAAWVLGRTELQSAAGIVLVALAVFAAAFVSLLSRRLRDLADQLFRVPGLKLAAPVYRKLSAALQDYQNPGVLASVLGIALAGLVLTNLVNYLAALSVAAGIGLLAIFTFNPLTPFASLVVPSVAGGLGVNQAVFVGLYHQLGHETTWQAAFDFSLVMQAIIILYSLPGGVLWWQKRSGSGKKDENSAG